MAKKGVCDTDKSCCPWFSALILVVGLLYLLQDYGVMLSWWRVSPWAALFTLFGLKCCMKSWCK